MKQVLVTALFFSSIFCNAQTISDFIKETDLPLLKKTIDELSGEVSTKVNGVTQTIRNRVSSKGNDIAADYIKEKLNSYGLTGTDQIYKAGANGGRNIYAVQLGKTKPKDIYVICGHYDAVADYCADDNLSGTVTVLEAARILSKYCFENTIVYAFWDEEETGLNGSKYYAAQAKSRKDNILGVLNIDMSAYDGDKDKNFDIDCNSNANSLAMKDLLLQLVSTHKLNLIGNVVNPGTSDSDHAAFWPTYGALLLGECWSKKDVTPFYHKATDRASTLNFPYYYEMVKLAVACIASEAVPIKSTTPLQVSQLNNVLTASAGATAYQWLDCNNSNTPIAGATNQTFTAPKNGSYAVRAVVNGCAAISSCYSVTTSGIAANTDFENKLKLFPNPAQGEFFVDLGDRYSNVKIEVTDLNGRVLYVNTAQHEQLIPIHFTGAAGLYFVSVIAEGQKGFLKLVLSNPW
jgi:hypothetical protein